MIQAIVIAFMAIWLAWGLINVVWGLLQIFVGICYGIYGVTCYAIAYTMEFAEYMARKFR